MRWPPWKKKDEAETRELERAKASMAQQKSVIAAQRAQVDAIAGGHRRVLVENHLAEAVRNALRNHK